jgi:hypothetical protein
VHELSARKTIQIIKIDIANLAQSYDVVTATVIGNFGYNSFAFNGNDVYVASQSLFGGHKGIRINKAILQI